MTTKLIRIDRAFTADRVDSIAIDPSQIEIVFWIENPPNHPQPQPCALISMKDQTKIYWMITRSEYDDFIAGLVSPLTGPTA